MDREEAIKILQEEIDGNLELTLREWQERDEQRLFPALRTAIEALSQPNYETDTEVRLAVTNRKKEKVILWDAYGEVEYYPIKALSAEATDLISRADALEQIAQAECGLHYEDCEADNCACDYIWRILNIPSADRPSGEWVEKEVMVDEDTDIKEWQSAKCSVCGKYHTTPYMYYFDSFNYCPNCGAKMGSDTP